MSITILSEFTLGDTVVRYHSAPEGAAAPGLSILPRGRVQDAITPREFLDEPYLTSLPKRWQPFRAQEIFPLVHVQARGDILSGGFAQGRTLLGGSTTFAFRLLSQKQNRNGDLTTIATLLATPDGLTVEHRLQHREGETALTVAVELRNNGSAPRTIDLLTSFALGGITPFASNDASGRLRIHRFRSAWSAEGRAVDQGAEELGLERSWSGYGVRCERFGQVGSMPTNGYFPTAVIEDRPAGVCWGAKIAHPGSWQLELYRRGDQLGLAGGLADREFGHWSKQLASGESFAAPVATLAVVTGGRDDVCRRLNEPSLRALAAQPLVEKRLPVIFNEWCTTWGNPSHEKIVALADRLRGSGVSYLVVDDGWAERPGGGAQQNGDWILNHAAFPQGLKATADAVRERGLIPGLWFEFEVINPGSAAWSETAHHLHRDGVPLQVGTRRFWDFRDPWVHDYLQQKVTGFLRDNNLGYLKVDYNDSIGHGCDGAESPGEALRQHLQGVQDFFRKLRAELPDLVIENCSSGGHRAESSMMALTAMTSFSDAHETPDIPVIAANLHPLLHPAQNQIWAVLRKTDSLQRLSYSLAATFLGRMCLSGDVSDLSDDTWTFVREGIDCYRQATPLIAAGTFRRHGIFSPAYQHLTGWQAVTCFLPDAKRAMIVWHAFRTPPASVEIPLPSSGQWRIVRDFGDRPKSATIQGAHMTLLLDRAESGGVLLLEADPPSHALPRSSVL